MYKEIKNELLELSWVSLMKDTLRYENSFKMCVYIKEKKSENGRLFQNDKFYFNFTVWTFNGKYFIVGIALWEKSMKYEFLQMIKCGRK